MLVREARLQGVKHIVVTHAMIAPSHMSIDEMIEAADLGAYIEFVYNGLVGPHKEFVVQEYADAIHRIGTADCILASDLGQVVNPVHPDGLLSFFRALQQEGFEDYEIQRMAKDNPADLLGLDGVSCRDRRAERSCRDAL